VHPPLRLYDPLAVNDFIITWRASANDGDQLARLQRPAQMDHKAAIRLDDTGAQHIAGRVLDRYRQASTPAIPLT
jgi:hypothetical protein